MNDQASILIQFGYLQFSQLHRKCIHLLRLELQFSFHLNIVKIKPLGKLPCQIRSHIFETTFVLITIEIQKPNADIFSPRVHLNGKP